MNIIFYIASLIAIISTVLVITRKNTVHALLYLIVSLLSVSVIFFILGAPFIAALEVIIYAGAIMVLFIFVIMMLNLGRSTVDQERRWFNVKAWIGPGILTLILLAEFIYILATVNKPEVNLAPVSPQQVGFVLYSRYILGVELTAMLLMSGIVGAYHIGRGQKREYHRFLQKEGQKRQEQKKVLS